MLSGKRRYNSQRNASSRRIAFLMPSNKIVNANHHWWPESLSKFWADSTGHLYRFDARGKTIRSMPPQFGAKRNAYNVKFAQESPWNHSFENDFSWADTRFPSVVSFSSALSHPLPRFEEPLDVRLFPISATSEDAETIVRCILSLVVRSPSFLHIITKNTEYARSRFGFTYPADKTVIAMNQKGSLQTFEEACVGRGRIALLFAGENSEFIFGDGFYHNFASRAAAPLVVRCIVPLTPELCVLYSRPISYLLEPKIMGITLKRTEVDLLNECVQIYAGDYIFSRREKIDLSEHFSEAKRFFALKDDSERWIDSLFESVAVAHFE